MPNVRGDRREAASSRAAQKEVRRVKIAFDIKLMRPACVLLQAVYGCDAHVLRDFNGESWLLVPTDDLRLYELDEKQLRLLSQRVNDLFPPKKLSPAASAE
jgi:hypothetical protein